MCSTIYFQVQNIIPVSRPFPLTYYQGSVTLIRQYSYTSTNDLVCIEVGIILRTKPIGPTQVRDFGEKGPHRSVFVGRHSAYNDNGL